MDTPATTQLTPNSREKMPSVFTLLFFGASLVLLVLFVNAKRDVASLSGGQKSADGQQQATVSAYPRTAPRSYATTISLPTAKQTGGMPVNEAIAERRSRREFSEKVVTQAQLSQMLFAGQGLSDPTSEKRTIPSARESYPMTLYVVIRRVDGITPGLYEYLPKTHALGKLELSDLDTAIKESGVQEGAQKAPVVFFVSAAIGDYQAKTKSTTTTATYLEAGHIGQNLYLTAESLDMGMVVMAGFDSTKVVKALKLDPGETVEYVVPFGHPAPVVATPAPKE